jgi:hypothetical protein
MSRRTIRHAAAAVAAVMAVIYVLIAIGVLDVIHEDVVDR